MITLYKKHVSGQLGTWRVWVEGDVIHYDHSIVEGGATPENTERVTTNQSGRSLDEQIILRVESMISKRLDRGYKRTREEAIQGSSNQLGLPRPMLAKKLADIRSFDESRAYIQYKLDGHRCLITKCEGELIAYTRQGKLITSISHILDELRDIIPEDATWDGELYTHGHNLQKISSLIKREQPDSKLLRFVVYDQMSPESFMKRYMDIYDRLSVTSMVEAGPVKVLTTLDYKDSSNAQRVFRMARDSGYEGLIIRIDDKGYEAGARSSSLIKMKEFFDDEFEVLDVVPSKDGWGICVCKIGDNVFRTSAPGTVAEKFEVMTNKQTYIGKMLTVSFADYTDDGLPFQPTAVGWREM